MAKPEFLKHEKTNSPMQVIYMIDELLKQFPVLNPFIGFKVFHLYERKKYAECVSLIKNTMGIPCKIKVQIFQDEEYVKSFGGGGGHIVIPDYFPPFNSNESKNMRLKIILKRSILENYHSFIQTMAHELSHVVLYSTGHIFKHSEISTELLCFIFGFGPIIKLKRDSDKSFRLGYLSNSDIEIAEIHTLTKYSQTQKFYYHCSYYLHRIYLCKG